MNPPISSRNADHPSKTIEWTYDQAGNKTRLDDDNSGGSNQFTYDELNRLTQETTGQSLAATTDYTYDPAGNILEVDVAGEPEPTTYTYNEVNLVKTVDDQRPGSSNNLISFSYDKLDKRTATYYAMANGDVLSQKAQWDNDGQPTCIYSYRSPDSDPAPDGTTSPTPATTR